MNNVELQLTLFLVAALVAGRGIDPEERKTTKVDNCPKGEHWVGRHWHWLKANYPP